DGGVLHAELGLRLEQAHGLVAQDMGVNVDGGHGVPFETLGPSPDPLPAGKREHAELSLSSACGPDSGGKSSTPRLSAGDGACFTRPLPAAAADRTCRRAPAAAIAVLARPAWRRIGSTSRPRRGSSAGSARARG